MAITALNETLWYPNMPEYQTGGTIGGTAGVTLNAASDKVGFVFRCPKSGTLDKAEVYLATVTNNPDNGLRISFQTVDVTTGFPDTVQDQYRDVTGALSAGWLVPGLMTSDGTDLGSKRTVTAGEMISVVVEFVSFVASDSVQIGTITLPTNYMTTMSGWTADASTGTYAKSTTGGPMCVLKYDDGTYAIPSVGTSILPITDVTSTNVNTGSTPDEYAARFQIPISARIVGLWARVDGNEDFELVLYNGTTAERTITVDVSGQSRAAVPGIHAGYFSSSYTVSANSTYYVAVKPTTATNIQVYRFNHTSNSVAAAWGGGAEWYEATRTDGGAWSTTTSNKLWAGLLIDGFDSGSGGGGSFTYIG